ncbi:MAG: ABC transporter substrate-binding protein [Sulfitobacter sp.]|nr:ABC transporter substrate-binding protein [Sulfitobacter sp.]
MTQRSPNIGRRALFSNAAAAALLAASGLAAAEAPRSGGRLRLALSGAQRSDTWTDGAGLFMQVARQGLIHDTLTEVAADGTLRGELATGWRSAEAGRQWHFDLRAGVPFHDGTPFTARDAAASLAPLLPGKVTAEGALTLRVDLDRPMPSLPLLLSRVEFVIHPGHAPGAGIGTGLYALRSFVPGQRLIAGRVARHWKDGQAGWFDEVELTSIPAEGVRGQALRETLVDGADLTDPALLGGLSDLIALPDRRRMTFAVMSDVAQPALIGRALPLDDLRAAERWWFRQG